MRPTTPGEALEMALAAKRLTQAALAEHLGVNPATVNHWIKGRRKLTIEDVARIAVFLEVDPAVIAFPPMQKPRTSTRTKPLPKPRTPRRALPSPLAPTGT
jgi:transcriptional regulator with XRE-family HTH domain